MEALNNAFSLDDVLVRMRLSQWPSLFCHTEWLIKFVTPAENDILVLAAQDDIRIPSLEGKINEQCSCIVSFRELAGPFGFLVDLDSESLSLLMRYLMLYIYHNGPENKVLHLRDDAQVMYLESQESFSREGAIYKNTIASYAASLYKMLAVSFGSSAEKVNVNVLSEMGFFCLRILLCSQLSHGFMNILMLKLHPRYVEHNPFQYSNNIACRNSKLSLLMKYLFEKSEIFGGASDKS